MTITSRALPDGGGYRHTCFICGNRWLSDAKTEAACPKCDRRQAPTTRRLASLARGEKPTADTRESTSDEHMIAESPDGLEVEQPSDVNILESDAIGRPWRGRRSSPAPDIPDARSIPAVGGKAGPIDDASNDDDTDSDDSRRHSGSDRSLPVVRI